MDDRVAKLKTPEDCERFAKNARDHDRPDLADEARRRAVELRAAAHHAVSEAEKEALKAIYAYEEALSRKNGKRTRANRTWQMIKRHGLIASVERAVNRPTETAGYRMLKEMGLQDLAFEAIVIRYPDLFSEEARVRCAERLEEWAMGEGD
jgi:hypothetical protein